MSRTKIFPTEPKVTLEDIQRIKTTGVLNSWGRCVAALNKENFSEDDLKRIVLIESKRGGKGPRKEIISKVLIRLKKLEYDSIKREIWALKIY